MGFRSKLHRFAEKAKQPFTHRKTSDRRDVVNSPSPPEPKSKRESFYALKDSLTKRFQNFTYPPAPEPASEVETARTLTITPIRSVCVEDAPSIISPKTVNSSALSLISISRKPIQTSSLAPKLVLRRISNFAIHPDTRLLEYANEVEYNIAWNMTEDEIKTALLGLWLADQRPKNEMMLPFLTISGPFKDSRPRIRKPAPPRSMAPLGNGGIEPPPIIGEEQDIIKHDTQEVSATSVHHAPSEVEVPEEQDINKYDTQKVSTTSVLNAPGKVEVLEEPSVQHEQPMLKAEDRPFTPPTKQEEEKGAEVGSPSASSLQCYDTADSSLTSSPATTISNPKIFDMSVTSKMETSMSLPDKTKIKELRALAFMAVNGDEASRAEIMALYEPLIRKDKVAIPLRGEQNDFNNGEDPEDTLSDLDDDPEIAEYCDIPVATEARNEWYDSDDDDDDCDDDTDIFFETGHEVGTKDKEVEYHKQWIIRKAGLMLELQSLAHYGVIKPDALGMIKKHLYPKNAAQEKEVEEREDEFSELVCRKAAEGVLDEDQETHILAFAAWGPIKKPADWDDEKKLETLGKETATSSAGQDLVEFETVGTLEVNKQGRPIKPLRKRRVDPA